MTLTTPDRLWHDLARAAADAPACRSLHLVGGPVRDRELGLPLHGIADVDTVVEGDAVEVARLLHSRHGGQLAVHERFGTATWLPSDRPVTVDIVTARTERYASPGALPDVEPASLLADLRRRDFTINSMALRLWPEPGWQLVDPLGGREDLSKGLLRIHHARSFVHDPTRVLRLARLAVRLELREEPATRRALDELLGGTGDAFGAVSGGRLWAEWDLLCREPDPPAVARWLAARGVARCLDLDVGGQRGQAAIQRLHEAHASTRGPWDPELALAALVAGGSAERAARRLGLTGRALARLVELAGVGSLSSAVLRAVDASQLDEALGSAGPRHRSVLEAGWPETAEALRWYEEHVASRRAPLDGGDLLQAGLAEGPEVGQALRRVRAAWLRGEVTCRAEALALLGLPPSEDGG